MRLTKILITSLVFALPPLAESADAPAKNAPSNADKTFNDFLESEWNYEMEQNPTRASSQGDRRWNDRWGDRSLEAYRKREEHTIMRSAG